MIAPIENDPEGKKTSGHKVKSVAEWEFVIKELVDVIAREYRQDPTGAKLGLETDPDFFKITITFKSGFRFSCKADKNAPSDPVCTTEGQP